MELFNSIPFTFEGTDFEIRIFYDDTTINVVSFLNGHPACGYRYQVKIPKDSDVKKILENHPVPELVENCKNDIKEKRWDKRLNVLPSYYFCLKRLPASSRNVMAATVVNIAAIIKALLMPSHCHTIPNNTAPGSAIMPLNK